MSFQTTDNNRRNNIYYPLVLFDGYCNLCSGAVKFILKYEKKPLYYFMSLQSPKVKDIFPNLNVSNPPESVILIEGGKVYRNSSAGLRIFKKLKFPFYIVYYGIFLPLFIRDPLYKLIAKHRYKWFGKKSVCFVPDESWKSRFMD